MLYGKKFTDLTRDAQKEIIANPVYARLLKDQRNVKTLLFARDKRDRFYIVNFFDAFVG